MLRSLFEYFLFTLGGFAGGIAYTTIAPVLLLELERRSFLLLWSHLLASFYYLTQLLQHWLHLCSLGLENAPEARLNSVFLMYSLLATNLLLCGVIKTSSSNELFIVFSLFSRLGDGLREFFILMFHHRFNSIKHVH